MLRASLARLLDWRGGGNGLFRPVGGANAVDAQALILVLSPGEIPTTGVYLRARSEVLHDHEFHFIDTLATEPSPALVPRGARVIVVRHVPRAWLRLLGQMRAQLGRVTYLIDDDIPAVLRAPELPLGYAWRTAWRYASLRRELAPLCDEIWVSTPELQRRYAASAPRLLEPVFHPEVSAAPVEPVYFYHGSWAHRREIEWLVPIVREVQTRQREFVFEILGGPKVQRLFAGIDRVRVLAPMRWPEYLRHASNRQFALGLAPCFDTQFNRARSHVKIFDITRLGAAGLYSDVVPFSQRVIHQRTGLLCPNHPQDWIEQITQLLADPPGRRDLHAGAMHWCADNFAATSSLP